MKKRVCVIITRIFIQWIHDLPLITSLKWKYISIKGKTTTTSLLLWISDKIVSCNLVMSQIIFIRQYMVTDQARLSTFRPANRLIGFFASKIVLPFDFTIRNFFFSQKVKICVIMNVCSSKDVTWWDMWQCVRRQIWRDNYTRSISWARREGNTFGLAFPRRV